MITQEQLFELKLLCDKVKHCGDYGLFYLNEDGTQLIIILGDADNPDMEDITEYTKSIGVEVIIEAEYLPDGELILISHGIESNNFDMDDLQYEDEDEDNNYNLLSLEEYADFLRFFRKCPSV